MKEELKNLLIADLCGRIPYGCLVSVVHNSPRLGIVRKYERLTFFLLHRMEEEDSWEFIKPYLRPLTSMTDDERAEYEKFSYYGAVAYRNNGTRGTVAVPSFEKIDWLLRNHFDFRGLIEKKLAIAVDRNIDPYLLSYQPVKYEPL